MRNVQRLERLEHAEEERTLYRRAERIAKDFGLDADDAFRRLQEVAARVERWGIDAELRAIAREHGLSEEKVRADYEAVCVEVERRG